MTLTPKKQGMLPSKWEVTALIWVAYLLNQADRQVFNVLLTDIQQDLGLTLEQMGHIGLAFNICYAVLVPIGGIIGDRYSRKWILTLCILFWSIATMFTGWATGLISLIILRSVATGGGEALFGPNYNSLLSEHHTKTRSIAMSIVQTAYYVGMIASAFIAGKIAELYGWEYAFIVFGAIGVIHSFVMMWRLRDNRDVAAERKAKANTNFLKDFLNCIVTIFRTPTAATVTIGFIGLIFVLTGYLTWMPTYLRGIPFEMEASAAATHSMLYTHLAAFFGVLIAGKLSDYVGAKGKFAWRTTMQGLGLLVAAPCLYLMGNSTTLIVVFIALGIFGFTRAFFDANTYVVLYDVIHRKYHSAASSVMIMLGFGIGALGAYVPGAISQSMIKDIQPVVIETQDATETANKSIANQTTYKFADLFKSLQQEFSEITTEENAQKWAKDEKTIEKFKTLGLTESNPIENLKVVDTKSEAINLELAKGVLITNAESSMLTIEKQKEAESKGLSYSFSIFAIIWVVCGIIMIVGGKLFYKRDILKLQQNEK